MKLVEVRREGLVECWLTAAAPAHARPGDAADRAYAEIAAALATRRIAPLQEKIYGPLAARAEVLAARRARLEAAGADPGVPCTYIDGRPGSSRGFAGVQIWGVAPSGAGAVEVATVTAPGGIRGRELRGPGFRVVHLAAIGGSPAGAPVEAMIAGAEAALGSLGLGLVHVARTWFYLGRLLEEYAHFNRVRTAIYAARGIGRGPDRRPFPASTGIQGTSDGAACVMDLLAAAGPAVTVEPIESTGRQGPAFDYGSSFSRGAVLHLGRARTLLVSGTASIDRAGRSRHDGDPEAQILETLLAVGALLDRAGATLADIGSATVFVKDEATLDAFRRVARLLGLPGFPFVPLIADVCRPELLFEMEAVVPCRDDGAPAPAATERTS